MLELVGLTETEANRRVGNYSLGMRQRLGIATALIGDPAVLILDEPANGLDPAGIRWMRDLLRGYADQGGTVLLSSHLLHEIEVIADDIVMIGNGRIVCQGSKTELLQARDRHPRRRHVRPQAGPRHAGLPTTVSDDGALRTDADPTRVGRGRTRRCGSHRAAHRRRRTGGHVPAAHRRHPTRKESGMTTIDRRPRPRAARRRTTRCPSRASSAVELRKMFDTRSGFWLMASIVITGLLTTVATIAFAPDEELTYYTFAKAVGFPMTVILPMIAILSITSEWSQRSGLTTFTLVPHRNRVIAAKALSSVAVAVASMVFAFAVGAIGNLVGTAIAGTRHGVGRVARRGPQHRARQPALPADRHDAGHADPQLGGRRWWRTSSTRCCCPTCRLLATNQDWFRELQPWVDLNFAQGALFEGTLTSAQWANVASSRAIWIVLPGMLGLRLVMRSEVK